MTDTENGQPESVPAARRLVCPQCRKTVQVTAAPGAQVNCPLCGRPMRVPPADPLLGKTIGGFRILRRIGRGGMGAVYLAEQLSLHRNVALKSLRLDLHGHPEALERFRREAISGARINHPNIVRVYDITEIGGQPFIVMEYVDGISLRRLLQSRGRVKVQRAVEIMKQVLTALARAHRAHVVHRDIKPENILIDRDGVVKVADFGLASIRRADGSHDEGPHFGTPAYVSPEHAMRRPFDHRTDIYSAGVVFYEMLTGRVPVCGENVRDIVARIGTEQVPPPAQVNAEVPAALSAMIMKMLALAPADRHASAEAVLEAYEHQAHAGDADPFAAGDWLEAFDSATHTGPGEALATHTTRASGNSAPLIAGIVIAAALGVTVAILALVGREPVSPPAPVLPAGATPPVAPGPERPTAGRSALEAALERTEEFAAKHPDQYRIIISNFERIRLKAKGTSYERLAADRAEVFRARWNRAAQEAFAAMTLRADNLAAQGKHKQAEDELARFPVSLLTEEWQKRLTDAADGYYKEGQALAGRLANEAVESLRGGRLDEARQLYKRMEAIGYPFARSAARTGLERVADEEAEREREWAVMAEERLPGILRAMAEAAGKRRYAQAVAVADGAMRDAKNKSIRRKLGREKRAVREAESILKAVFDALKKTPGSPFRVRGILGEFTVIRDGNVVIRTAAGELSQPVDQVPVREIIKLAERTLDLRKPRDLLRLTAFCAFEGEYEKAGKYLNQARDLGARVSESEDRLRRLRAYLPEDE